MSYENEKYPGSYRGVPFFTQGHSTQVGRKVAIYRLPFESRGVAHLDLGRAPRRFKIRAILLETPTNSLRDQRDAFVAALETEGAGLLVHPIYGRVNVVTEDNITITESTADGGKIEIDFEAIEAREEATATSRPDVKATSINAARKLRVEAGTTFAKNFSLNVPDFVAASNLAVLDNVVDGLTDLNAIVGSALAVPAHFAAQIDRIAQQTATLLNTPGLLYNTIDATLASLMQSFNTVSGRNRRGVGSLLEVTVSASALGASTEAGAGDTPSRIAERSNRANMLIAMRSSALAAAAETAANASYDSANEAREVLDGLVSALTGLSDYTVDGVEPDVTVYDALRDLIAALTAQLTAVAGSLSELTTYTPPDTLPALVVAYGLYGDANRADEILARNPHIVHPLFVPGRVNLEILTP